MKRHPRFLRTIAFATACAVAFATGAAAQVVEIPDAPIGEEDFSTGRSSGGLLAALPPTSRDTSAGLQGDSAEVPVGSIWRLDPAKGLVPVTLSAGTGNETRVGVDVSAAEAASEGWPWYGKAALVVGCVLVAGLATWAIVEGTHSGSHDDDSSQHMSVGVGGEGNHVTVHYHSPTDTRTENKSGGYW